ncbi:phosphoribosylamine--glycine ligase [Alkalibacter rhizosphaerae]|uniref:Phosphoribosylamine--glycine ligase n=1 Tax=Alkalibacter rhizosphaerae TaxID=2815577 RepID=A0A974XCQ9_9FIRM|nr:phosphoribosylamine--glycine ligase [Alkalibacter rhizosphaerae]QSX07423.1 phosphoribosylamine--glycine ligase [Alkalibacter rhizosphaerae]
MKILVIGSGGREHALVWKLQQSPKVEKIYCAPGNAGTSAMAENVDINVEDLESLANFAQNNKVDLTVVGPELPLVLGITDLFQERGLTVFGPNRECAQFEGSKAYTKKFLEKHAIPTAAYKEFHQLEEALDAVDDFGYPLVVKADGLAAGKGVIIAQNRKEAVEALEDMMAKSVFGASGERVVLEEFLEGTEASVLCFVDGKRIVPMESARDYKRIGDKDEGPNTGGMGTYSPNQLFNEDFQVVMEREILRPIEKGFMEEGLDFRGVLFIGLMIKDDQPKVLEFNVRFGDPETESVLMRMDCDLVDVMGKVLKGDLSKDDLAWKKEAAACVVLASGGYPDQYEKGMEILGLDQVEDVVVFHCGTKILDQKTVTNGGRVLAVTALGADLETARDTVYREIPKISFNGMQYRTDIGQME